MKVTVRNPQWAQRNSLFFSVKEFKQFEGDEVNLKWVKPSELALSTGLRDFPIRVLDRASIINIDGKPYSFILAVKSDNIRKIKGSNGKIYEVTGNYKCTCPGFTFRGSCKHLEMK